MPYIGFPLNRCWECFVQEVCWWVFLGATPVREWKKQVWADREAELWCSYSRGLSPSHKLCRRPFGVFPNSGKGTRLSYLWIDQSSDVCWEGHISLGKEAPFDFGQFQRGRQLCASAFHGEENEALFLKGAKNGPPQIHYIQPDVWSVLLWGKIKQNKRNKPKYPFNYVSLGQLNSVHSLGFENEPGSSIEPSFVMFAWEVMSLFDSLIQSSLDPESFLKLELRVLIIINTSTSFVSFWKVIPILLGLDPRNDIKNT